MPEATELLHSNLHEVFSERNPERRQAAIGRTYTEDVTFIDPEGEVAGRQALSDKAQKLLDGVPAGFVLEEDGRQGTSGSGAISHSVISPAFTGAHHRPVARAGAGSGLVCSPVTDRRWALAGSPRQFTDGSDENPQSGTPAI